MAYMENCGIANHPYGMARPLETVAATASKVRTIAQHTMNGKTINTAPFLCGGRCMIRHATPLARPASWGADGLQGRALLPGADWTVLIALAIMGGTVPKTAS